MNRVLVIVFVVILGCVTQSVTGITCHEGKKGSCIDADTCFTRFKLETSWIGEHSAKYQDRGCKSTSDSDNQCNEDDYYCTYCKKDDCNDSQSSAEEISCVSCESGSECTKSPHSFGFSVGFLCFTEWEKEGDKTLNKRSKITTKNDLNTCRKKEDKTCEVCSNDKCNGGILPTSRRSCVSDVCLKEDDTCTGIYEDKGDNTATLKSTKCSSETSKDCPKGGKLCKECENGKPCTTTEKYISCIKCEEGDLCTKDYGTLPPEQCSLGESCFVETSKQGKNARGCTSSNECPNGIIGKDCYICDKDVCNNIKFPDSRKECKDVEDKTLVCLNPNDECFGIYSSTGILTASGCKEEIECIGKNCKECQKNGCAKELPTLNCVQCDHDPDDPVCTTNPSSEAAKPCQLDEQCFVANVNGKNTRGCTSTDECPNGIIGKDCYICDKDVCNNIKFPDSRNECKNKEDKTLVCLNPDDECFGIYSSTGKLTSSGCKEEISCTDNLCKSCAELGNVCAKYLPLTKCVQCDHDDDPSCTTNPNSLKAEPCQLDEKCFVANVNGKNKRGCLSIIETCDGENCYACPEDSCNDRIFPIGRQQCYYCNQGGHYCDSEIKSNSNGPIDVRTCIDVGDKCFTKITKDISSRGCLKEVDDCDENCAVCEGIKCNTQFAIRDAELSCYKCKLDDPGCGYMLLTQMVRPSPCKGKVLIGQEEKCYSFKNDTIERGCVLELDETIAKYKECAEEVTCNVCSTNNCNNKYINTSTTITGLIYLVFGAFYVTFIYNKYSSI